MRSISSISVMISMLLMNDNGLKVKAECIPEGCYYDIQINKTKEFECQDDGSLTILHFYGDNGCDYKYFDPKSSFKSSAVNTCCDPDPEVVGDPCNDVYDCDYANMEYCKPNENENEPPLPGRCVAGNDCTLTGAPGIPVTCFTGQNNCDGGGMSGCWCSGEEGESPGICVPNGGFEDVATEYSVTVINNAGQTIDVGIFQTNPSDSLYQGSFPVVFASQGLSNKGQATFSWKEEWGLSWASGTSQDCVVLEDGIIYTQTGNIIPVSPTDTSNNGAKITYIETGSGDGVWSISASPDSQLSDGLLLTTDDTFTNSIAANKCFTVCVTLSSDGKQNPVFVADGLPDDEYEFELKPTYYISRVANKAGMTVSESSVTVAYPIEFGGSNGNDIILCINDKNQFEECSDLLF